jgi:hypothetical protein
VKIDKDQNNTSSIKRGGRPTKLTPDVAACICRALRAGVYIETAVVFAGISPEHVLLLDETGGKE